MQIYVAGRGRHGRLYKIYIYIYSYSRLIVKLIEPCPPVWLNGLISAITRARDIKLVIKVPVHDTQFISIAESLLSCL